VVSKRMDLKEAAQVLGITSDSVRKRVKRGTLPSETGEDGRLYVWLDLGSDSRSDAGSDEATPADVSPDGSDALVGAKDETIRVLEAQLRAEREASAELRRIVAGLVQRVPELEPAREPSPQPSETPTTSAEPRSDTQAPPKEENMEPRSWWRRFFGL
jgi:hypothetical protein